MASNKNVDEIVQKMSSVVSAYNRPPLGPGFTHSFSVRMSDKSKYPEFENIWGAIDYEKGLIVLDSGLRDHPFFKTYVGSILAYFSPLAHLFERISDSARLERSLYLQGLCKYVEIKTMLDLDKKNPDLHFAGKDGLEGEVNADIVDLDETSIESITDEEEKKMNIGFRTVERLETRAFEISPKPRNYRPQTIHRAIALACAQRSDDFTSYEFDENFGRLVKEVNAINILDIFVAGTLATRKNYPTELIESQLTENKVLIEDQAQARYVIQNVEKILETLREGASLKVRAQAEETLDSLNKVKNKNVPLGNIDIELVRKFREFIERDHIGDLKRKGTEYFFI